MIGADAVSLSLRVRDVSRSTENAGTDIPVVREEDFRAAVNERTELLKRLAQQQQQ